MIKGLKRRKPKNLLSGAIVIFDDKNRILLQHRTDSNNWCIPGGSIEVGETTVECAIREVFEETNLTVHSMDLYNVYSGNDMHWVYPDGNEYYIVSVLYITRDFCGKIKADMIESKDVRFFNLDELPDIISTNKRMIKDLCASEINKSNI